MAFLGSFSKGLYRYIRECIGRNYAVTATNYLELNVKKGSQHYIREYHTGIAAGTQKYYLIRFGADPLIIKTRHVVTNSNNVFYRVYYNADISADGTPIPIENFNEVFQITPQATAFEDPTIVSTGTYEIERWLPGAVDVGNRTSGEYQVDGLERIVRGGRVALIEFDNQGTDPVDVEYILSWYEGDIHPLGDSEL